MNRENLEKLATYLEKKRFKTKFDMSRYTDHKDSSLYHECYKTTCGSVGCAIGHGPYAGLSKNRYEPWSSYSNRVFDIPMDEWIFLFSPYWKTVDNTPKGAAKRIRWLLEGLSIVDYMKENVHPNAKIYKELVNEPGES